MLAFAQPEWRTLDGRNNNKNNPTWGKSLICQQNDECKLDAARSKHQIYNIWISY